jgi:uncharacterized protein YecT (DUF1311 family)
MKRILLLLWGLNCALVFSQTQSEMNEESLDSFYKADKELNEVYRKILIEYKSDTTFIKNLKISQRIWITFRNAELKMKYPDREPYWYGSMQPVCENDYLKELTRERIKKLKEWFNGVPEGEGCGGSIKRKN